MVVVVFRLKENDINLRKRVLLVVGVDVSLCLDGGKDFAVDPVNDFLPCVAIEEVVWVVCTDAYFVVWRCWERIHPDEAIAFVKKNLHTHFIVVEELGCALF